jgi:hypothetical protein
MIFHAWGVKLVMEARAASEPMRVMVFMAAELAQPAVRDSCHIQDTI